MRATDGDDVGSERTAADKLVIAVTISRRASAVVAAASDLLRFFHEVREPP